MFDLLYDQRRCVLLCRFHGPYGLADIVVRDRAVRRHYERFGPAHRIGDLSEITSVEVPMATIVERYSTVPLPALSVNVVARGEPGRALARVMVAHQYFAHRREMQLFETLDEAYRAAGAEMVDLRPVAELLPSGREPELMNFVAGIDEANWREDRRLDELARDVLRRRFDTAYERGAPEHIDPHAPSITVADLLNSELRTRIGDNNLSARCHACSAETTLSACRVTAHRDTVYACAACDAALVVVRPLRLGAQAVGYPLAGFDVDSAVDIACLGTVLPAARRP